MARKFTWKELKQLNRRENAHVAYRGKVYDVSSFVSQHPGGMDQIMLGAGRDITQLFESYHKVDTVKILEKYYVGELVDNEMAVFSKRSEFYTTLKQRVDDYFKKNNIDPKIDYWMFLRCFTIFAVLVLSHCGVILFQASWILGILFAVCRGFFATLFMISAAHDCSHFAITHNPWVWQVFGSIFLDFSQGASMLIWKHQHILGHHIYTNVDGLDPDIVTAPPEEPDFRRIKYVQKWISLYPYQHIYAPILYGLLGVKTKIQNLFFIFAGKVDDIHINPLTFRQWLMFFGGKFFYCITHYYIPYQFMPLTSVIFYSIVAELSMSYWLVLVFEVSHVISEVEWTTKDENNTIQKDWSVLIGNDEPTMAELQVESTQDYSTDSWFWTVFTGAINHHVAHHLFPGVIQSYYPHITPIVKQTCEEFGIQYHYVETAGEALACHINHLRKLGQEPEKKEN